MATVSIHALQARALRTLLGLFLALFFASPADAILINIQETVTWLVPGSWTPTTPWFTDTSTFAVGNFITTPTGVQFIPTSTFHVQDSTSPLPSDRVFVSFNYFDNVPQETVGFEFNGTAHTTAGDFPAFAFPIGSTIPSFVPSRPPVVPIGRNFIDGFASIELRVPLFACDAPVQVGTADILVSPAPEPGSLFLMALGFVALMTIAGVKANRRFRPK